MKRIHDEVVHGDRLIEIERWSEIIEDGGPPIAIEHTVATSGVTKPPVVLVHGFAQNRYTWRVSGRSFVAALAAAGHEVLNLELRGHGRSRAAGSGNAERYELYFDDLVRVVERCEQPPFGIGHSLGGGVLIGASSRVEFAGLIPLAGLFTFASHNLFLKGLGRATLAMHGMIPGPARLSTGWIGGLLGRLYSVADIAGYGFPLSGWTPGSMERALLEERLSRGFDWTSVEVWLEMSAWANGAIVPGTEAFREVTTPLLVICGDGDPLVRPQDAQACFDASPATDKQLIVFDAFNHEVHWGHVDLILGQRAPEFVWPTILEWIAERS